MRGRFPLAWQDRYTIEAVLTREPTPRWLRTRGLAVLVTLALIASGQTNFAADSQERIGDVLSAIVGVRTQVPTTARTAETLGTERRGSGVVIDDQGLIVTIGYLILEASRAEITLADGKSLPVQIVAYDHNSGFGLLRSNRPLRVKPMRLGDSGALQESARVLVSGFGGAEAARPALVVSRRVFAGYWEYLLEEAIFTAPPYENFSGAALIGPQGELLGIGSLVVSDAMRGERTLPGNMFVPIDALKPILPDMLKIGRSSAPPRPWLGIYSEEYRGRLFVTRLADDGPAADAGIQINDIIVKIGDGRVSSLEDFYRKLWATGPAGVEVQLLVLRRAQLLSIKVRSSNRYSWLRLNPI
jgi:S1-C subfamily serine protease